MAPADTGPRLDDDRPCGVDVDRVSRDVLGSADVRQKLGALAGAGGPGGQEAGAGPVEER